MKIRLVQNGVFTPVENVTLTLTPPAEGFYWIDADMDDLMALHSLFSIHDLVIEDCLSVEEQRPKIEIYEQHYFIVVNSIRFDDEEIFLRSVNIFLGRHFIITVTKQKVNELRALKPLLWEHEVNTPDRMLYLLTDLIVDSYFTVSDRIEVRIETLEEDILINMKKSHLNEIIGLRSEILWLKKVLGPQKEVIHTLNKKDLRLIDETLQKYFSDIYENAVKISETFETFRDLMGNLREAYQAGMHNRLNEIMRILTALTTIFIPPTLITSIYGMNFQNLPVIHSDYGFSIVMGISITLSICIYFIFRKKDWL